MPGLGLGLELGQRCQLERSRILNSKSGHVTFNSEKRKLRSRNLSNCQKKHSKIGMINLMSTWSPQITKIQKQALP